MPPTRKRTADYSVATLVAMIVIWVIIGLGFAGIIANLTDGHH